MNFYDVAHRYTSICKCSKCGGDALVDDSMVLTSMPPKYNYDCLECGYHGYIDCGDIVIYYSDKLPEDIGRKIRLLTKKKNPNIHFVGESTQSLNGNGETITVPKEDKKDNTLKTNKEYELDEQDWSDESMPNKINDLLNEEESFLQYIMKTEEELLTRMYETNNSFEYIELKAKLELLKEIKNKYTMNL